MSRSLAAILWALFGILLGLGARPALDRFRDRGCDETLTTKYSPDRQMRVTLSEKPCSWGFGLAAYFASLHIEKLGKDGWVMDVPLDADQPSSEHTAEAKWKGNDTLQVTIRSEEYSGSLERRVLGFHLVQTYTKP